MNRKLLIEALGSLQPGLNDDLLPVMACFCFGEKSVHAYNDVVAMDIPYGGDFKPNLKDIAVHGRVFLNWLKACTSADVEMELEKETLKVKCGRSKTSFPTLAHSVFQYQAPAAIDAKWIDIGKDFIDALIVASSSMGTDVNTPWRLGVTLKGGKKGNTFYSTDNKSAVKVFQPTPDPLEGEITLPVRFCELLRSYGRSDLPVKLGVGEGWCQAVLTSGLTIYSNTIPQTDVNAFQEQFNLEELELTPIPKGLDHCLERAQVVLPMSKHEYTQFKVQAGKLKLITESSGPKVEDRISIAKHKEITVMAHPATVAKAIPFADQFVITKDFILFKGKGITYLVSTIWSEVEEEKAED
jgi:DNA polymerase III sliding clamp (beta) subunit (PCNA family)